jgi:hypothetical protein
MDSIIQRLLQQQQKNHGIDEAATKLQREWQPFSDSYVQEAEKYVPEPFDNDDSHLQNHNRTRRAGAPCIIAGYRAKQDLEDPDRVIEKKRQRKELVTPDSERAAMARLYGEEVESDESGSDNDDA